MESWVLVLAVWGCVLWDIKICVDYRDPLPVLSEELWRVMMLSWDVVGKVGLGFFGFVFCCLCV